MALMTQVGMEFIARNKANQKMLAFGNSIRRIRYRLRGLATGLLAVAGVGGFGYMIKRQMETIDVTAKLSDRLGLATERLVGLQHAASITGTNAETLNKSLEIFVRRLGEMTQGSGEAKRGLDMLGLTAELLINKSPAEAFGIAADRIKLLRTQAEKTAAAYFLFGRAGSQMLNMLESGSKGLKDFQTEAERLGLTFSRFDAAQIEAANDALTRARATMTGLFRQVTIELAPYIETLANRFVDFATKGEGVGANVVNVFEYMSLAAIRFGKEIQGASAKFMAFKAGALDAAASYLEFMAKIDKFTPGGLGGVNAAAKNAMAAGLRAEAEGLMEAAGRMAAGTYGQESAVKQFFTGLRLEAAQRRAQLESRVQGPVGAAPSIPVPIETMDVAAAHRAMYANMKRMTIDHYRFRVKVIEDLRDKYAASGIERLQVEQWYIEQVKKLDIEQLRSSENMFDGLRAAGMQMQLEMKSLGNISFEAAMTMQRGFGDAFADVLMRIETVNDALRNLAMSVARVALTRMGENIYAGIYSGIFSGLFAKGGTPNVFTSPHGGPAAGSYQHGGWITHPTLALMGEREPELVTPLSKMGGLGGVQIIIQNTSPVPLQQGREPYIDGDDIVIQIEAALNDRIHRGAGPLKGTIQGLK